MKNQEFVEPQNQARHKGVLRVAAAVVVKDRLILAARRRLGLHLEGLWEFPGGKIESGETGPECLVRELMEELNIRIEIGEFVLESVHQYSKKTVSLQAYLAQYQNGTFSLEDHDEVRWMEADELMTLCWAPADLPIVKEIVRRF
jgi:8-oxo-dGTP diphosphatase